MTNFNQLSVDPATGNAVIGTGNRLATIVQGLNNAGRAMAHGVCARVGIGGHASEAGWGPQSRLWGLTIDAIISHEVVLANGTIVNTTPGTDLFWVTFSPLFVNSLY